MIEKSTIWLLGGVGLVLLLLSSQRRAGSAIQSGVGGAIQSGVEDVQAAVQGWKAVNQGPVWVPVLNIVEAQQDIPRDLLARVAYQESRFRQDVIEGTTVSKAGALGLMQLEPAYFSSVRGWRPFTTADTGAQITEAAQELGRLHSVYQDWGLALAAYNDGEGNVDAFLAGSRALPSETVHYVADVLTDVPLAGATMPA